MFTLILMSFNAVAEECPITPDNITEAIENHIREIRASEYCPGRSIRTDGVNTIVVYTAEGACDPEEESAAGLCGNHWERYMIGSINGKIIGPIEVGRKGELSDKEIKITGNLIELTGLAIQPKDSFCCPSLPQTKKFEFSQDGFNEIKP